ncbi:EamA family transporter [Amycolatopsis speibonae]|uniref:EamA family transporter n=1 Tax=Amycolatopsis speibonae TaxID=1450224 RepID=A0ABV7P551_9PSEU
MLLWLLALAVTAQVAGWLLIGKALSALPSSGGSAVLMLQPAAAILFGALLLGQEPGAGKQVSTGPRVPASARS